MVSFYRQVLMLGLIGCGLPAQAQSGQFEDLDRLEARVVGALGAGIGETGGPSAPIDRRLKLARCPVAAQISAPVLGALTIACPAVGWRLRVPLQRIVGPTIAAPSAQPVIRKGDPVEIFVESRGFSVSTETIAQEDGAIGDRIRVKADSKAPVMIAEIVASGRVRLPGY